MTTTTSATGTVNLNTRDGVASLEIASYVKTRHGVGSVSAIDAGTIWVCFYDDDDGHLCPLGFPIGNPGCELTTPTAAEIEAYELRCIAAYDRRARA